MSAAASFFWVVAATKVLLSVPIQIGAARKRTPERLKMALGQRKDDWLAMAVMVVALVCDEYPLTGWMYLKIKSAMYELFGVTPNVAGWTYLFGTVLLAWLVQRTMLRLRCIQSR
jgi:hypothetical protein